MPSGAHPNKPNSQQLKYFKNWEHMLPTSHWKGSWWAKFTCLIGLSYLLELCLCLGASSWVLVRMPCPRKPPIRLLEVIQGCIAIHLEDVVVVHSHLLLQSGNHECCSKPLTLDHCISRPRIFRSPNSQNIWELQSWADPQHWTRVYTCIR